MNDLLAGLGVALVLEGLLWALAPAAGRRMVSELSKLPDRQLSLIASGCAVAGLALVWLARG